MLTTYREKTALLFYTTAPRTINEQSTNCILSPARISAQQTEIMLMGAMFVTARFQDVNRSPFKHTTQANLIKQAFTLYNVPLLISLDVE